ncbi:MAG TPA: hypothetical protein VFS31_00510 [Chitinophagaceae bacterium]|nr:hypothetical protein [Chitinophagaceae bacterium]
MKYVFLFIQVLTFSIVVNAQTKTKNLVVVTLDGMRWQEVFKGIDPLLTDDSLFNRNSKGMREKFWAEDIAERNYFLFCGR